MAGDEGYVPNFTKPTDSRLFTRPQKGDRRTALTHQVQVGSSGRVRYWLRYLRDKFFVFLF